MFIGVSVLVIKIFQMVNKRILGKKSIKTRLRILKNIQQKYKRVSTNILKVSSE